MKVKRKKQPAPTAANAAGHLRTVVTHKYLVARGCFAVGLYRQGILHDLSKFSPTEFMVGARYWQGNRSPNNAERETIGYSSSWLHHKGRNRHHYEYWVDYNLRGEIDGQVLIPVKMPGRYVVEMLMDGILPGRQAGTPDASGDRRPAGKIADHAGGEGREGDFCLRPGAPA